MSPWPVIFARKIRKLASHFGHFNGVYTLGTIFDFMAEFESLFSFMT